MHDEMKREDVFEQMWARQAAALGAPAATLPAASGVRPIGRAGQRVFLAVRLLEVALGAAVLCVVLMALPAHLDAPRQLLVVAIVAVLVAWITAQCAVLFHRALRVDWSAPVVELQRAIERLRLAEYRAFKWALLGGVVLWLPLPVVLLDALTGGRLLERLDLGWLAANVFLGAALLGGLHRWSRRHVERAGRSGRAERLLDALSSRHVRRAAERIAELEQFAAEPPAATSRQE
ncbi:MAG: hypothetical protein FJ293_09475 [Planctomycetes bacterium]|nr:hypothetical protein [Planctomycetota bacterium]